MSGALFTYDVFLSHSSKDKAGVGPLAERLREDGLRNGSQPSFINPQSLGGLDWAQLHQKHSQLSTLNHQPPCAPLNQERRFISLRLDEGAMTVPMVRFVNLLDRESGRA